MTKMKITIKIHVSLYARPRVCIYVCACVSVYVRVGLCLYVCVCVGVCKITHFVIKQVSTLLRNIIKLGTTFDLDALVAASMSQSKFK